MKHYPDPKEKPSGMLYRMAFFVSFLFFFLGLLMMSATLMACMVLMAATASFVVWMWFCLQSIGQAGKGHCLFCLKFCSLCLMVFSV